MNILTIHMVLCHRWISKEDMKAAVDASYSGAQYDSESVLWK